MSDTHHPSPPVFGAPPTEEQKAAAKKRAEEAKADADKRREEASKKLDEDEKARQEAIAEAGKREAEVTPTPTQRELNLGKLGHTIDEHEDDGSGPEVIPGQVRRDLTSESGGKQKYKTK
jgi:hypothetical protein